MNEGTSEIIRLARSAILEDLQDAVFVLDEQLRIVGINPSGRRLLNVNVNKLLGQPADRILQYWSGKVILNKAGHPIQEELTIAGNSVERVFSLRATPIQDCQHQVVGHMLVLRDITLIKKSMEALNVAWRRSELLSKFGHDLRTPLNGILGLAEMLDIGTLGPLNDEQRQAAQRIVERIEYVTRLVSELGTQNRLESNQLELICNAIGLAKEKKMEKGRDGVGTRLKHT
jgi:PAS domain S-box-containing protein